MFAHAQTRLLLIEFVADARNGDREHLLAQKEKRKLIFPVGRMTFGFDQSLII